MKIDGNEVEINVIPEDLWGLFNSSRTKLRERMVRIASNPATNTDIYLTETYGMLELIVLENDEEIYKEPCCSAKDSEFTLKDIYDRFLFSKGRVNDAFEADGIGEPTEDEIMLEEELTFMERQDAISERENELYEAFEDFMTVVLREDAFLLDKKYLSKEFQELKDRILIMISESGFPVYRPMFVNDADSGEVFSEYPYDEYDFT